MKMTNPKYNSRKKYATQEGKLIRNPSSEAEMESLLVWLVR